jgi:hypothetical protein
MATQHKPQLTHGQTDGTESGPLTRGEFDRLAAIAFRRLWMTLPAMSKKSARKSSEEPADAR